MRRLAAGLALAALVAACGGGTHSAPRRSRSTATSATTTPAAVPLTVRPAAPTTRSPVTFSFRAPASSGHQGTMRLTFTLTVAGPRHAGCQGARMVPVTHVVRGAVARVATAAGWCAGGYAAQVQEFASPYCSAGQMCPQHIRLVGTVARATFRVASG